MRPLRHYDMTLIEKQSSGLATVRTKPISSLCIICNKQVRKGIRCNICSKWAHNQCVGISGEEFKKLKRSELICKKCKTLVTLTEQEETDRDLGVNSNIHDTDSDDSDNDFVSGQVTAEKKGTKTQEVICQQCLLWESNYQKLEAIKKTRDRTLNSLHRTIQQMTDEIARLEHCKKEAETKVDVLNRRVEILQNRILDFETEKEQVDLLVNKSTSRPTNISNRETTEQSAVNKETSDLNCINYVCGDLFLAEDRQDIAMVHCVGEDLAMKRGIAASFKKRYGRVDELKEQNISVGDIAVLNGARSGPICYLVTKKRSMKDKPTLRSMFQCLVKLKMYCVKHEINEIAMPKIGCGLDKLRWKQVSKIINSVFGDSLIKIKVYIFNRESFHNPENNLTMISGGCDNENNTNKDVVILGDSMVFNVKKIAGKCKKNWDVVCRPGLRMDQLTKILKKSYTLGEINERHEKIVICHVGTNSLRGWKKSGDVVCDTWELIKEIKMKYPNAKIGMVGIIRRRDISFRDIDLVNRDIEWVAEELGASFLDPNYWMLLDCIGRDGIHPNFRGCEVMTNMFSGLVKSMENQKSKNNTPVLAENLLV